MMDALLTLDQIDELCFHAFFNKGAIPTQAKPAAYAVYFAEREGTRRNAQTYVSKHLRVERRQGAAVEKACLRIPLPLTSMPQMAAKTVAEHPSGS